jgi:hypothetical protein
LSLATVGSLYVVHRLHACDVAAVWSVLTDVCLPLQNYQALLYRQLETFLAAPADEYEPISLAQSLRFIASKLGTETARQYLALHHEKLLLSVLAIGSRASNNDATWEAYSYIAELCLTHLDASVIVQRLRSLWYVLCHSAACDSAAQLML